MDHGTPAAYKKGCRCEICAAAKKAKDKEYYERNKETVKARVAARKAADPEKVAETDRRYRERNAETLREKKREYSRIHAQEARARAKAWAEANPEKRAAHHRLYRERHREERRVKALERYYRLMAQDPERVRKLRRDWFKTQKGILAGRAARHQRRGAPYTVEAKAWIASLVDPTCYYCGRIATEIDHIIPVSKGGTGERSNLVPSCRSCNARKNALGLDNFLARLAEDGKWPLPEPLKERDA